MKLLSPAQYIQEATEAVTSASERVYVASMVLADHELTRPLIKALKQAARRGVKVVVAADLFTYGEVSGGFLPLTYYSRGVKETNATVKALKKSGIEFHWLGRSSTTLFNGRTHTKWCVADDIVFAFGGVNLYKGGILNNDYMFKLKNPHLASRLVEEQEKIQHAEQHFTNYHSTVYEHDDLTVLLDGGIAGQSVIYARAVKLAIQAEKITLVSQYCPTGRLGQILKKKSARIYFNRPLQAEGLNRFTIRFGTLISGIKTSYTRARYLHAKLIIFTMPDGSKVALTGSHNFAYAGVLLGTREIALETTDPDVIRQLERFVKNEVA